MKTVIQPETGVLVTCYCGLVTIEEIRDHCTDKYERDLPQGDLTEVTDLSNVNTFAIAAHAVRDVAESAADSLESLGRNGRVIIIAPTDNLYGMASVYHSQASFSGREKVHVVRTDVDAAQWLGVDIEEMRELLALPAPC